MQNIIYEYEEIKEDLEHYKKLKNHIINTKELHKYFTLDWKDLKAKQYCGILNFDNQDFYILPKIANNNEQNLNIFIYMLMYAYDIKLSNEQIASCQNQEKHTILEVFVQMFANGLLKELKKGIYKKYITEQENLSVLKGKYLINENLKYNFTKNKIYCEYDEFSSNNNLNQFFLYTVKYLQKFVNDKKLLKQCELIFDEVDFRQIDINKINIHFDRLNLRFKISFEIALLLLKQSIPLFNQDKKSFAFLFDMNILFEKFIAKMIKELDSNAKIQNQDEFGDLTLKPDIILENQIIDTKYKKIKSLEDIKQSDKLQAFTYGINYKLGNVMLLYPKHLDNIKYDLVLGKESLVNLKIRSIDLNYDENSFDRYIKEIKQNIRI
ncbi:MULTISPECIES: McrC family protein [Arcobacteraceae]|uniref:Restriction endonuclease n=2 Tax=Aliarcobacter thereius TaxID=544718 RepID=A0A5R9H2B7_9BACT|nr:MULTISPECIES: restriction endonuclease [Arcobacteraceae]OCL83095.1 5-methylcytosine-specific restriction enzyme subunit McrC [Arcobacter porcinus]OCL93752.1 5-methylcytosine-specific restriction enzyme subunit McrC [Aliarcobacter thereius]OCL95160.1 5-methylcytosine-specific restriction enzyme subunit McrC [Aliarcobacter thereius LMG 24486]QBF16850.1 McrBC 5-methylcytosine restriction system, component McrC [Aliarcobacter thereius LMG 24486]TLS73317.1 restriction endonuclease [Aliarcobacter